MQSFFNILYKRKLSLMYLLATMLHFASAKNLTSITWSHGTNSQKQLSDVLNSQINFIEADISIGTLLNDELQIKIPIMAHPPNITSDISLQDFLTQIKEFNKNLSKENRKGVKLDFKSIESFNQSLVMLNEMYTEDFEIWLNADIYSGPVEQTSKPVDADEFLMEAKKFSNSILSIGWTTRWGGDFTDGSYTNEQVNNMINGIRRNNVENPITFPVRAGIAANSLEQLKFLYDSLKDSNQVTFTIWSSSSDYVDVEKLRKMIFFFGIDKVYIDVPDHLLSQLDLSNDPYTNSSQSLKTNFVQAIVCMSILFALFF